MEQEKNKKRVIVLLVVIIVILLTLVVLLATGIISFKSNEVNNNQSSEKDETGIVNIDIKYSGEAIDLQKYILEFNSKDEYKDKLLTLTVSNINLNGENHVYKFENHPQNCLSIVEQNDYNENYNNFYIDNVKIGHQGNQACYLSMANKLFVVKNKYIVIYTDSEGGSFVSVYDEKANLIDYINGVINIDIKNDEFTYKSFDDEHGCYINNYLYTIPDNKPVKEFKSKEKNTSCNEMTGQGCSYLCGN